VPPAGEYYAPFHDAADLNVERNLAVRNRGTERASAGTGTA
jgi:hypothetical protein